MAKFIDQDLRDPIDAEVDISYKQAVEVALNASPTTRPRLYNWYSWDANTGYYWQLFNSAAADGNIFGLFQGSPAQIEGCASACWSVFTIAPQPAVRKKQAFR